MNFVQKMKEDQCGGEGEWVMIHFYRSSKRYGSKEILNERYGSSQILANMSSLLVWKLSKRERERGEREEREDSGEEK
jgi:hypothetical protein